MIRADNLDPLPTGKQDIRSNTLIISSIPEAGYSRQLRARMIDDMTLAGLDHRPGPRSSALGF
jgi:hypothetical protein